MVQKDKIKRKGRKEGGEGRKGKKREEEREKGMKRNQGVKEMKKGKR